MVGLSKLQQLAARVLRVEEGPAFVARFRHLHSMSFPPMPPGARGKRFDYRPDECLATTLVLVMQQAFVPPGAAVAIVMARWPEFVRQALDVLRASSDASSVAVIRSVALGASVGVGEMPGVGVELSFADGATESAAFGTPGGTVRGSVVLDLGGILADVRRELGAASGIEPDAFAAELSRSIEAIGALGAVRLCERDFYWSRAMTALTDGALSEALATGEPWRPSGDAAVAAAYVSDPLPRERSAMSDPLAIDGGVSFSTAFETLRGLLGDQRAGAPPVDAARFVRAGTSKEHLLEMLVTHARERAASHAVASPSASLATERRRGGRRGSPLGPEG